MKHYFAFLVANAWFFVALVVFLGGQTVRHSPVMLAFFGQGQWLAPNHYYSVVAVCVALGAVCLAEYLVSRFKTP